ncbi:MAG TPA: cytochrome c [Stellaceae bacterium]|jgi:mono/diheme cytochrome c family protein|nr:cytochrome c [Stellaceae bacterium]
MRGGIVAAAAALVVLAAGAWAQNSGAQTSGGQPAAPAQATPPGDAKVGQQLFLSDGCWECHGTAAQGGAITGPRLAHTALPFAAVLQQLRVPQNAMPPYEASVLPDSDVANIYAFLESLPAPQTAANIPLLSQ